ncbi:hypothetical protein, partial [Bradyrhizobium sp. Cp5.3]|uniref:hypothetical protein n=1 Tax=Bradyrhizobium sp. Cp5.3 TaxID=443598 RepID=UPI001AEBE5AC
VAGEPAGVISLVMALLSFVESAPRAYRLKVGNADLFRNSTEPGTSPRSVRHSDCRHETARATGSVLQMRKGYVEQITRIGVSMVGDVWRQNPEAIELAELVSRIIEKLAKRRSQDDGDSSE